MGVPGTISDALLGPAILDAAATALVGVAVTLVSQHEVQNVYLSDEAVRILGGTREELLAVSALTRIAPEERERLGEYVARRRRGELKSELLQTVILRPDGSRLPIATAATQVIIEGTPASISFFWDLTELKSAEGRAHAEQQRLRSLIESSPDAIVISADGGGRILFANSTAAALIGADSPADMVGQSISRWVFPADVSVMKDRMQAVSRGEHLAPREYQVRRNDGGTRVLEIVSRPFVYDDLPANIAFARDVTERLRLQEQLTRAHQLAALGTLAAGVAHEINNPLAATTLLLDVLDRRLAASRPGGLEPAELASLIAELRHNTERVAGIVRDLRAFSRPGDEKVAPVDLNEVLLAADRISAHATRQHVAVHLELPRLPLVSGNAGRLEQVFVNLLVNAAEALPRGRAGNEIRVRAFATADRQVVVEVQDNGPGIPPELRARVFDPFFTTKAASMGTGLGLAISHGIVTRLGGQIEVDSEPGTGTTMRVRLPALTPGERLVAVVVVPDVPAAARARVLIIDDEPAIGAALVQALADQHQVDVQSDPRAALALLLAGASFDVILCDLIMPGLAGVDLYRQLEAARPELARRVIFISGESFESSVRDFLATVPNEFVGKPFRTEQVLASIARTLEAGRQRRQPSA